MQYSHTYVVLNFQNMSDPNYVRGCRKCTWENVFYPQKNIFNAFFLQVQVRFSAWHDTNIAYKSQK